MPEALASAVIPADPEVVWPLIRDFDGLPTWHPAIATSALRGGTASDRPGAVRTLGLADGGDPVVEMLVALDDRQRTLTYEILESPFPVRLYRSTIRVVPLTTTGESFVEWTVVFDCDAADAAHLVDLFSRGVFATGLEGLTAHLSDGDG